jgi:hypothetical protein
MTLPISGDGGNGSPANARPSTTDASRRAQAEARHAAFEHALGSSFERWFQAPGPHDDEATRLRLQPAAAVVASRPTGEVLASRATLARAHVDGHGHASGAAPAHADAPAAASDFAVRAQDAGALAIGTVAAAMESGAASSAATSLQALVDALAAAPGSRVAAGAPCASAAEGAASQFPPALAAAGGVLGRGHESGPDDEALDAIAPPPAVAAPAAPREPLRVHAEWSEVGVRVWIGADPQVLADLAELMRQLQQWLGAQGLRLLGVVCNGRDVWTADDPAPATHLDRTRQSQGRVGAPVFPSPTRTDAS